MEQRTCSVDGCERPAATRGWCAGHYSRWKRTGDAGSAELRPYFRGIGDRLAYYTDDSGNCWEWTGARNQSDGYGRIRVGGRIDYAHRVSYEHHVGPIPDGLHLDHLCRNPPCVNPTHLEPVTCVENVRRGEGHGSETHCPQGHPYEGDNLYVWADSNGYPHRHCRTCKIERARRWREERRSA